MAQSSLYWHRRYWVNQIEMSSYHNPVLLRQSVDGLNIEGHPNGVYIDATMGGAGHTKEILKRLGPGGKLISFDQDADAIANAPQDGRFTAVHNNFRFIENFALYLNVGKVDGILADLGVSSHQFDTEERGFSFRFNAPLDMRMNNTEGINAANIVNEYTEAELIRIFRDWGELDNPGKIAGAVCKARLNSYIGTTEELVNTISLFYTPQTKHKFLAKLFQALRIEVNREMSALQEFLMATGNILKSGGRLSVITYHSLEDRLVKNYMKTGNCQGRAIKDFYGKIELPFRLVNRKPLLPNDNEQEENSRSRSAKLRIAEKI